MSDTLQYDVVLSHNQADKPRVRRLVERRNTKAKCRRQNAEPLHSTFFLHPFPPVGLEHNTVGRGNCGSRNLPFRDPANAGRRFIPLLLADCKLPDKLRRVKREAVRWTRDLLLPHLLSGQVNLETN